MNHFKATILDRVLQILLTDFLQPNEKMKICLLAVIVNMCENEIHFVKGV